MTISAVPRPYPVIARLRYTYKTGDKELPVVENAWWESRFDGGRVLGAVVEAMGAPRYPHRLRVHLRFRRDCQPKEMEATMLRPDGEGRATYRFEAVVVRASGVWNGMEFSEVTEMPLGYTVAPHCLAADGLHFLPISISGTTTVHCCYLIDPRRPEGPLIGSPAWFTSKAVGEEEISIEGRLLRSHRFRTAYADAPDAPADFWVEPRGYALRMTSLNNDGTPIEIVCTRITV